MAFQTTGTVKRIGDVETKGEKFKKRVLILDVEDGKYPQTCEFQATGDRISLLDPLGPGDEVTIHWNLRGREWTGRDGVVKVFNSADIWKLEVTKSAPKSTGYTAANPNSDLPF